MSDPYVIGALIVGAVNGLAALIGLVQYVSGHGGGGGFWFVTRAGQAVAAIYAAWAGVYALVAEPPEAGLTWVYILTPICVSYFAEQLRLVAVQVVLERHGFESSEALREAVASGEQGPEGGDARLVTGIAHEIVLREIAVMAIAALVIAFLAWRAVVGG